LHAICLNFIDEDNFRWRAARQFAEFARSNWTPPIQRDAMTTMTESRPPQAGQQLTYILNPPLGIGCEVQWAINGQNVTLRSDVGGLKVGGFSGAGQMTVQVDGDVSQTTVTATIMCPGKPKDVVGPMEVGSATWPPPAAAAGAVGVAPPQPFPVVNWSWWDKLTADCPDTWTVGAAQCQCSQSSGSGFWPFYYDLACTYTCPNFQIHTVSWTLSFGIVVSGPN
jgi:hypothetical protein